MQYRFVFFLAIAGATPRFAAAQWRPAPNGFGLAPDVFSELQAKINSQARVHVRTTTGEWELNSPKLTSDSLVASDSTLRFSLQQIREIQVRGGATGAGAAWGAGVGGGLGFLAGVAVVEIVRCIDVCVDATTSEHLNVGAVVGVAGAAAGTLIGAIIGTPIKKWKTVYRAKERGTPRQE